MMMPTRVVARATSYNEQVLASRNDDGDSLLHIAAHFGQPAMMEFLLLNNKVLHAQTTNCVVVESRTKNPRHNSARPPLQPIHAPTKTAAPAAAEVGCAGRRRRRGQRAPHAAALRGRHRAAQWHRRRRHGRLRPPAPQGRRQHGRTQLGARNRRPADANHNSNNMRYTPPSAAAACVRRQAAAA